MFQKITAAWRQGCESGRLAAGFTAAGCAGVLVWYPWYTRGYVELAQFKLAGLLCYALLWVLLLTFLLPKDDTRPAHLTDAPALALMAFTGCTLASTLLSGEIRVSLWGVEGYLGGFLLCAVCLLLYLGLRWWAGAATLDALALPFVLSGAGVTLLGVANNFGLDPLGFYAGLEERYTYIFFSTIGNVDYLNSYLCLWLPVALWLFVRGTGAAQRAVGMACAAAGFVGLAALDPGIAMLGLAFAVVVLLCTTPLTSRDLARLAALAAVWLLAQKLVQAAQEYWPLRMVERPFAVFGATAVALPGAAMLALLAVLLARRRPGAGRLGVQRAVVAAGVAALALLFAVCNLGGVSLGGFDNFFKIGPAWATDRGALFADGAALFAQYPPLRKLLGCGLGLLYRALGDAALPYAIPATAAVHNEYLDLLLTGGVLGLGAWLAVVVLHLRAGLRGCHGARLGWVLGAAAYLGQAFFNNRVVAVFPLFVVVLALLCAANRPAPALGGKGRAAALAVGAALWLPATLAAQVLLAPLL